MNLSSENNWVSTECSSHYDDWSIRSKCRQSYSPNSSW